MTELKPGSKAPDFTFTSGDGAETKLSALKGNVAVVYFYPKDDTPGCTAQSCDFRDSIKAFEKIGAQIIGISKDSEKSHEKFKAKYDLNFPLVSDEKTDICERYGVWTEKSMYGKKYMGIERSTFVIGKDGKIAQIWRKVKVDGHVAEVAAFVKSLV